MFIKFRYENFGNLPQNVEKDHNIQKQPPEKFSIFHSIKPVLGYLFSKVSL